MQQRRLHYDTLALFHVLCMYVAKVDCILTQQHPFGRANLKRFHSLRNQYN